MTNPHDVASARARADSAYAQLTGTFERMVERLRPANLAQDAVDGAAHGVASAARKGVEAIRSRPVAAAGVAGLIGLVMARGWIGDIVGGRNETSDAPVGLKTERAPRASKGRTK